MGRTEVIPTLAWAPRPHAAKRDAAKRTMRPIAIRANHVMREVASREGHKERRNRNKRSRHAASPLYRAVREERREQKTAATAADNDERVLAGQEGIR